MHIVEGFLPLHWCIIWFILSFIFIVIGIRQMINVVREVPESKKVLGISGVFMFVMQFFGVQFVTGTTSSALGNGFSGSVFGPAITSVIAAVVLLLQAVLLGSGGLTTLGANIFSIGVAGPFVAYLVFTAFRKRNISPVPAMAISSLLSIVCSCLTTAVQFGLVYKDIWKFVILMFLTQLPLIVVDVLITFVVFVLVYYSMKDNPIFSEDFGRFLKFRK